MKLLGLQHCSLVVTDLEKSRQFYGQVLGMRSIEPPDTLSDLAWFESAGTEIHLIPQVAYHKGPSIPHSEEAIRDGADTHLAFAIASVDAALSHLAAHNVEVLCGPRPRGDGPQQLYIRDPDGYLIELFAWN